MLPNENDGVPVAAGAAAPVAGVEELPPNEKLLSDELRGVG